MEKQEHEEYMRKLRERYDKQDAAINAAEKVEMEILSIRDWLNKIEECKNIIKKFKQNLSTGLDDAKIIVSISKRRESQWIDTELYSYDFRNYDDLLKLIEDRMFYDLERALSGLEKDKHGISEIFKSWN